MYHEKILREEETEAFKIKLDKFDQEMKAQHPMFKFANDYMKFVPCIRMFLRATREGNWKPHLESLKSLCKYFFAHDRLNYSRTVPLHLAQMEQLELSDPDLHEEFMKGNFCVNKNDIPFCAIVPDHAIEHEKKNNEDPRWPQGFDSTTNSFGKIVSYCARTESISCRSRNLGGHTDAQLDTSPRSINGCDFSF